MSHQSVLCVVNVQHNCAAHACDTQGQISVYEEHERTTHMKPRTRHFVSEDIMLNTAQMRDAIHVQRFRIAANALDHDHAIMLGAKSEVEAQKQKQAKNAKPGRQSSKSTGLSSLARQVVTLAT
jgi:hypothetical protein